MEYGSAGVPGFRHITLRESDYIATRELDAFVNTAGKNDNNGSRAPACHAMQLCRGAIAGAMLYAGAVSPRSANADLISLETSGGSVGGSVVGISHNSTGREGYDSGDSSWSGAPANPLPQWLRIYTNPIGELYGGDDPFQIDNRGMESMTPFNIYVQAIDTTGTGLSSSGNSFFLQLIDGWDTQRQDYNLEAFTINSGVTNSVWSGSMRDRIENHSGQLPVSYDIVNAQNLENVFYIRATPVAVLPSVLTASEGHGSISPSILTNLFHGHSTNFVFEAENADYHVASIMVDGAVVYTNGLNRGVQSTNINYVVTVSTGHIHAVFVESTTSSGIPLTWLTAKGVTNKQDDVEGQDLDGDTYTVFQEYLADTHPTNGTSFFPPVSLEVTDGTLRFGIDPTSDARRYYIEATTNLAPVDWQPVTNAPGTGGAWSPEITIHDDTPKFFRGKVTLP